MIYLIVAPPGHGKTNLALDLGLRLKAKDASRPLYVSNVRKPNHELLGSEPLDHVRDWQDLPDGSIVLIDELQDQIPQRDKGHPVPDWLKEIAKHRHRGFDFIFTTQHASLVDVFIRRQTGEFIYLRRKARALSFMTLFQAGATTITWDRYEDKPDDFLRQRRAVKKGFKYNKRVFDMYESTTKDTHRPKVPWQIPAIIAGAFLCIFLLYRGISSFRARHGGSESTPTGQIAGSLLPQSISGVSPPTAATPAVGDRMASFLPRIRGVPVSAPAYDNLQPTTIPRVYCMASGVGARANGGWQEHPSCTCLTEQGTPVDASPEFCRTSARYGTYDPYKADRTDHRADGGAGGTPAVDAAVGGAVAARGGGDASMPVASYGGFRQ